MNQLKELQESFQNYILAPHTDINIKNTKAFNYRTLMESCIVGDSNHQSRRLAIYYEGYRLRLLECMGEEFEVTKAILGEDRFNQIGLMYLEQTPSRYRSVRYIGKYFAKFLEEQCHSFDAIAEMADFEATLSQCLDAKNGTPLTLPYLQKLSPQHWADMQLALLPAVFLKQYRYNTTERYLHWIQCKEDLDAQVSDGDWLIWREDNKAQFRKLDIIEIQLLSNLQNKTDFGTVCGILNKHHNEQDVPKLAMAFLLRGIHHSFIALGDNND